MKNVPRGTVEKIICKHMSGLVERGMWCVRPERWWQRMAAAGIAGYKARRPGSDFVGLLAQFDLGLRTQGFGLEN